jgi:hypothetical protein
VSWASPWLRRMTHPLPGRTTLEDTRSGLPGFLEPWIEATSRVASILISSGQPDDNSPPLASPSTSHP